MSLKHLRDALAAVTRAQEALDILSLNRQDTRHAERHLIHNGTLLALAVDEFLKLYDRGLR